jgi:UDP-2,3-diacylglucosamine pyrophosphatase LpxH
MLIAICTYGMINMILRYRSIWISDTHLGTKGCKAEQLMDFWIMSSSIIYIWSAILSIYENSKAAFIGPSYSPGKIKPGAIIIHWLEESHNLLDIELELLYSIVTKP